MGNRVSRLRIMMILAAAMLLISSCASLSRSGVGRVKHYTVESARLPQAFDGCRVAFVSDIHYPSLFDEKRLGKLVSCLNGLEADMLLLGGDYVTENDSIDALFGALGKVETLHGIYAVLGNHERGNATLVGRAMEENGIVLLADSMMYVSCNGDSLCLAGVSDSFSDDWSPFVSQVSSGSGFVILLAHTPDYAERTSTAADLVLSGHTHGGQVTLFGMYTPVKNSAYGKRFLRGLNRTGNGVPVITTNGVGTSRRKVRFCVPSEIVVVTLRRACQNGISQDAVK